MSYEDTPKILKCPYCKEFPLMLERLDKKDTKPQLLRCFCGGISIIFAHKVEGEWRVKKAVKLSDTLYRICGNCRFWEYTLLRFACDPATSGLCHKNAAGTYCIGDKYLSWPYVDATGWCGEYKPAGQETNSKTEEK